MDRLELKEALASLSEAEKLVHAIADAIHYSNAQQRKCANPRCSFVFPIGARQNKLYCCRKCLDQAKSGGPKRAEQSRNYRSKHPEMQRKSSRRYYLKNRDKENERRKLYREHNKEKVNLRKLAYYYNKKIQVKSTYNIICGNARCGRLFERSAPNQKYCSRQCRIAVANAKAHANHYQTLPHGGKFAECLVCGNTFEKVWRKRIKYCSKKCMEFEKATRRSKESKSLASRRYRAKHPDRVAAKVSAYHYKHREEILARQKKRYLARRATVSQTQLTAAQSPANR